ncbi:AAA family ATPase [Tepidimonas taiwanensis]|uniref:AAA family ATPase n=1 Tax=Tepidimonas taiwanensis TaxID=307486 RepID=UPI000734F4ED|nr:AAA family ATPase [Tepidimonas taiwanensis]
MSHLYLSHFGLRQPPFDITPDPRFFFVGGQRGALLEGIAHAVFDTPGIILVIGEVGSGKTMLCRMLAQRLRDQCTLIYLANPSFGPQEILRGIAADLGLTPEAGEPLPLALQRALLELHARGRQAVLLIDEAQAMPPESIEEVKLLSNLETGDRKLLQIILFGQPELDDLLSQPRLRQVRDRVVHRFAIPPLPPEDASRYLDHRLACAGSAGAELFDTDARRLLVTRAQGSVRRLNILADQSLLAAYAAGASRVQREHVDKVLRTNQPGNATAPSGTVSATRLRPWWQRALIGVAGVGVGTLAGWWLAQRSESTADLQPVAPLLATSDATTPPPSAAPSSPLATSETTAPTVPAANATAEAPASPASSTPPSAGNAAPQSALQPVGVPPTTAPLPAAQSVGARYAHLDSAVRQIVLDSRAALDAPDRAGYTLQVGIETDSRALARWTALPRPDGWPLWIHDRHYKGQPAPVWAVYLGWFETREAARTALRTLSPEWAREKPQIRTLAAIRDEGYPEQPPR